MFVITKVSSSNSLVSKGNLIKSFTIVPKLGVLSMFVNQINYCASPLPKRHSQLSKGHNTNTKFIWFFFKCPISISWQIHQSLVCSKVDTKRHWSWCITMPYIYIYIYISTLYWNLIECRITKHFRYLEKIHLLVVRVFVLDSWN